MSLTNALLLVLVLEQSFVLGVAIWTLVHRRAHVSPHGPVR